MTRGILIAGNESSLLAAVGAEAAKRVEYYAEALIPNRLSGAVTGVSAAFAPPRSSDAGVPSGKGPDPAEGGSSGPRIGVEWNAGSPLSARTVTLAAENRLGQINEAILVCAPPSVRRKMAELHPADIETMVNDHIRGWFYLARELASVFRAKQAGTLALVYSEIASGGGKDETADLLGPAAAAAFRAFAQSLLSASHQEPYLTMGFSASEPGEEKNFSAFIFRLLDEGSRKNNGRLHKFGRLNLFGR
jgi:NAD(P)-dependent dehydrogenase (short-subunit alcohol dehydrogenase family)